MKTFITLLTTLFVLPAYAGECKMDLYNQAGTQVGFVNYPCDAGKPPIDPPIEPPPVEPPPSGQCDPKTSPIHSGVKNYVFPPKSSLSLCLNSKNYKPQGIFGVTPGNFPPNVDSNTIKTMVVSPKPFDMDATNMGPECKKTGNIATLRTATGTPSRGKCLLGDNKIYYLNIAPQTFAGVNACSGTCGARVQADSQ